MRVDTLALEDFRNYDRATVAFAASLNLVVGSNAQGKTNLLEAVYCLSGLGSPRSPDAALVRDGTKRALLHSDIARGDRELAIDIELRPGRGTRALVNKTPVQAIRELAGLATSVFFGPDELSLIKGSPEGRRRFLDDLVVKLKPARDGMRREWERVLKQRNALLKSTPRAQGASSLATLEVWDESLCRAGAGLASARLSALAALAPYARKRYEAISGSGRLELAYISSWIDEDYGSAALLDPSSISTVELQEMLRAALTSLRPREIERGISLAGPQRDDVSVGLEARGPNAPTLLDARVYASQGDQRTAALALKLAEHDLLADALNDEPVLLLDDVFSELDPSRREWLADAVRGMGQTFLSSAEPGVLAAARPERTFTIEHGRVKVDG